MKLSKHAKERIKLTPFKISGAIKLFKYSCDYQLKRYSEAWKFQKYGLKQVNVKYSKVKLEVIYTLSKDTDELITFTVKRINDGVVFGKDDQL